MQQSEISLSSDTSSENDDAVLLREWNFEKFFPNRSSHPNPSVRNSDTITQTTPLNTFTSRHLQNKANANDFFNKQKFQDKIKSEIFNSNMKTHNINVTKLKNQAPNSTQSNTKSQKQPQRESSTDSSKLPNFVRAFRRENTDFSLISKRHSVVLGERLQNGIDMNNQLRSSAIFQRNKSKNCDPVLTTYVQKGNTNKSQNPNNWTNFSFLRPRREKTESVILVRNSVARQKLLAEQQKAQQYLKNRSGETSGLGTPGTRTSSVLPDLLSQASPATPPRHDKSSSEE
uniref:Uncharacterized protein n=1 Tax=Megaselia scalaris TaxID=36166 RepID=T1GC34_MEGSC